MGSEEEVARRILEIIPAVMRFVGADIRRHATAGFQVSHYRVLGMLSKRPFTLSELASCQAVALPTMSRTVSTLVERGWVMRTEDPEDRRRVQLSATAEGRSVLKQLHAESLARLAERLSGLTPAEQEQVLAGLQVLEKVFVMEVQHESH
ncbi:MAG: MarR family transcriptional regulator [Chloroflexi bacterium]|nr:MAG: MarR family transcriptional regulator [Chloroflexota bacterium]